MFRSHERKAQLERINNLETWEEIQLWHREQPIMEGFFRGANGGWKNIQVINDMYRVFVEAMGARTWVIKLSYAITCIVSLGGGVGLGIGLLILARTHLDLLPIGHLPWYYFFGPPTGVIFVGAIMMTYFRLLWYKYDKVQIPVTIQRYNEVPNKPWPLERALIQAPRLAWIAEHGMFYFGPQGGNIETATHVRLKTYKNLKDQPANIMYTLEADENYAMDSPARDQRAKVLEVKRAARLRPKTEQEKMSWLNKRNSFMVAFLVAGIISAIMIMGR